MEPSESPDDIDYGAVLARLNQMEVLEAAGFAWLCQFLAGHLHLYAAKALKIATRDRGALALALAEVVRASSDLRLLTELETQVPANTVNLRVLAVELCRRIQQLLPEGNEVTGEGTRGFSSAERARLSNNLAVRFGDLGRFHEALPAAKAAARIYEALSDRDPTEFLPIWAGSLNNLAQLLGDIGEPAQAAEKAREAARVYRLLVDEGMTELMPNLGLSLKNQSDWLSEGESRPPAAALESASQAVEIYEQAAARDHGALPGLAASLVSYSNRLASLGHPAEALESAEKAKRLYEQLRAEREDAFRPAFAASLNNLANRLADVGRWDAALERAEGSERIYESLAAQDPGAFLGDWAMVLNNLSTILARLGRPGEARQRAEAAERAQQRAGAISEPARTIGSWNSGS